MSPSVTVILTTQVELIIGKIQYLQVRQFFAYPIYGANFPGQTITAQIQMSQVHQVLQLFWNRSHKGIVPQVQVIECAQVLDLARNASPEIIGG